jgi:hypothetical protein
MDTLRTSRRGLLAASLAVVAAGALGAASTLSAEAETVDAETVTAYTPPPLLPWGAKPEPMRTGRAGASSAALRAAGLVAAPAAASLRGVRSRYAPKGRIGRAGSPVAPAPTSASSTSKATFFYNVGSQAAVTDGFYANVTIARPALDTGDAHTLAELAVQSADGRQIVEIGWTVDRSLNGNGDPHLFVYHWVNGGETCYNGCGFVQQSPTVRPGDTLAAGTATKFGIQYSGAAWWVTAGTEWIGYFPERLWLDQGVASFARTGLIQVFGEVAAGSGQPCSEMGTGAPGGAYLASVTYTNGPPVALDIRSTSGFYAVNPLSARTFQYGGPGAC